MARLAGGVLIGAQQQERHPAVEESLVDGDRGRAGGRGRAKRSWAAAQQEDDDRNGREDPHRHGEHAPHAPRPRFDDEVPRYTL